MKINLTTGSLAIAVAVGAIVAGTMHATPANAETKILFNRFVPPKHPFNVGMFIPWAKDVEKATNGRVKVEFTAATLAPPPKQWNMVSKGIADAAMLANIFERNRLKLQSITQIPFGASSAEKRSVALWRTQKKYFDKAGEYKGMKALGLWTVSGANFYHTKKALTSVSDLKKEKMWAIAGIPNKMMTELGSVVVSVPGVDMFNVVSKGVVDGTVTSAYTLVAFKLMPYVKHITQIPGGFNANAFTFLFSEKKWNGLSQQDKDAIASVSGERIAINAGRMVDTLDAKANELAKKNGIKFTTASPAFIAEMKAKVGFVEANWLEAAKERGIDGPAALAYFQSQLK
ncbi:MAG: TRAP transporter substrate-binding protein [Proteobacteria bacterium]|nr:TRAP transporter substrate-binding protein [Pseudomonadota bacterium]